MTLIIVTMDDLLTRGVANIIPHKNELLEKLKSGHTLNVYLGIDPTATHIHLGHAVPLRKLQEFARLGHHVTFLIGDFTALIGDTSDKDAERPKLTSEQILENFKTYQEQASKIVDFSIVKVVHNSEWLSKLTFADIVKLCQHFSFGDFASRELIKKRLTEGKHVGLHEALYPVMQGYDSYHLYTDVQIGGADQTFNMQAGRVLLEDLRHKDSFVLATHYLTGTDGRKMSKSWGNAIWLDDTASDMYRKVMAIKDDLIIEYYTLGTSVSLSAIKQIQERLQKGENPRDIKKELAVKIVSELHGAEYAKQAQVEFEKTVQQKGTPQEMPEYSARGTQSLTDALLKANFFESKSELKRVCEQGGLEVDGNKTSLKDANAPLDGIVAPEGSIVVKSGKHNYLRIRLK